MAAQNQKKRASWTYDHGLVIFNQSQNPDAAWKLVKALTGDTMQKLIAESGREGPAKKAVLMSKYFLESPLLPKGINNYVFIDAMKYGNKMILKGEMVPFDQEIEMMCGRELEAAYVGQKSVREALISMQNTVEKLLKKEKKQ